ncbi:MAG: tetratricopeptide repeat protein, partial [Bacteroidales bacterium]|nr:tetratricopeptide repeat protein [Bacteroidales bacterium]
KMYPDNDQAPEIQEKIIHCHRLTNNDMLAYIARDKLYDKYKPGSAWWLIHEDEKSRERVYEITERVLRDNITLLYQKAEFNKDKDIYFLAVNDCRKYLKTFPTDSSAPRIHWNMALTMDTQLRQYDQAFEEYMKLCDLYWSSKYQRYAAENAIALAKDAVELDTTRKNITPPTVTTLTLQDSSRSLLSAFNYNRIELSDNEKKLARAFNNYIKQFPHEPQTVKILVNAGALHFNNNIFPEALRYFNTIVKQFPDNEDIDYIKYQILESYFGKGDYRSAEIVARKLKNNPEVAPELADKAKRRLAESIFLAAKVYADSSDHLQAGNEYLRVVREVPGIEFADLSLFNAAWEYDKAKEYSRAVETYNYLIETRFDSKYTYDAMNNLAIDYGELEDYSNAALTYERLSTLTADKSQAHDALYNSSVVFVKAEEWKDAIRINSKFVQKFPDSEDTDDMFYDIATFYLNLDELDKANQIYGEYADRFPNSPRVVETFFHRGKYYENKNEFDLAIVEYQKAVKKNEEFHQNNLETNDYFAAEALSEATKIKFNDFREIEFTLPVANMELNKKKKRDLLIEIVDDFTHVASFGTVRLYEATYSIGKAYEEFANTWSRQEIPPMEKTRRIVTQKEINETTVDLYGKAEDSYKQSVEILARLANEYEQSLIDADSSEIPRAELKKNVSRDSTLYIARRWIERSKEKISQVIYDMAELNLSTVYDFLNAPIPSGLSSIAEMEYNNQLLNRAIAPLIKEIAEGHGRNVRDAWKMGIENQWVKLSRQKILKTNNLLASEYNKLANKSLDLYQASSENYANLVENSGTTPEGWDAIAVSDQMANLIDFSEEFTERSVEIYKASITKASEENIQDPAVSQTNELILKDLYEIVQRYKTLSKTANSNSREYENKFKATNKLEYEDALFSFEDNYFSFKEKSKELLEFAYQISQDMEISNPWATKIQLSLVEISPREYSSLLDLKIVTKQSFSDLTWLVTDKYTEGWVAPDFNDEQWSAPEFMNSAHQTFDSNLSPIWLSVYDTLGFVYDTTFVTINDSASIDTTGKFLVKTRPQLGKVPSAHVYFRKQFIVNGLPVSAQIKLKINDSYNIFLNGEYVATFIPNDSTESQEHFHNLTDILVDGENLIAIEGKDSDLSGNGLTAMLTVSSLPGWEDKKRQILYETSDKKIKENLAMDKYIIIY